jgi:hypothetical protein
MHVVCLLFDYIQCIVVANRADMRCKAGCYHDVRQRFRWCTLNRYYYCTDNFLRITEIYTNIL